MQTLTAILPCNDLEAAEAFFARLGFGKSSDHGDYRILRHPGGGDLHLTATVPGWVEADRNPFGLYFYIEDVDGLAAHFPGEILGPHQRPENKPWGMYEFALNGPDGVLVRIGWPTRLRS
jgi:catechol 2,3-dioxygenase-like lactoylglutathione lyase family enzyme